MRGPINHSGGDKGDFEIMNTALSRLDGLTDERTYEEIIQYLRTGMSEYFENNPKEPIEEAILQVFDETGSELLRNKLRLGVAKCFERPDLFNEPLSLIFRLLRLVEEMRVTQVTETLLRLVTSPLSQILGKEEKSKKVKERIISVLLALNVSGKSIRDIIYCNIIDPSYTEICMAAAAKTSSWMDDFLYFLPTALYLNEMYPDKVPLHNVLKAFLYSAGKNFWAVRGNEMLIRTDTRLYTFLELLERAKLSPTILSLISGISDFVFEIIIDFPFSDGYKVSTNLVNPSPIQIYLVEKFWSERMSKEPQDVIIPSPKEPLPDLPLISPSVFIELRYQWSL